MMDNLENIDQLFRDMLHDYAPLPPAGGWQRLQGVLTKSREIRLIPVWLQIAASILLIAGAATLGWRYFAKSDPDTLQTIAEEQTGTEVVTPVATSGAPKSSSQEVNRSEIVLERTEQKLPVNSSPGQIAPEVPVYTGFSDDRDATEEIYAENPVKVEKAEEAIPIQEPQSPQIDATELPQVNEPRQETPSKLNVNELIMQNNLLALEESGTEKHKASWSVGGTAGPQYTYRDVTVNAMPYQIDDYDKYETGVTTYAGGFQVEVEPARRFSIQSGVYYSKIGQIKSSIQIDNQFAGIHDTWNPDPYVEPPRGNQDLPTDLVNSTGNITFDKSLPPPVQNSGESTDWVPGTYTAEQYFEFIEVPLIVSYRLIDRKFDVNISSGIWANFLVGNKATATDNENFSTEGRTDDINTFNYCGSLSLGFGYPLSRRLSLSLDPFFKYYLSPINSNPQTEVYPYSMGIMSGVKYLF